MTTPNECYPDLGKAIGYPDLYLKREDLHPYGSHKGRSIPIMIDLYYAKGDRKFAISSSGNAGLAAILHVNKLNTADKESIGLDVFVGNHIASNKLAILNNAVDKGTVAGSSSHIRILTKERPLQALTQAVENGSRV